MDNPHCNHNHHHHHPIHCHHHLFLPFLNKSVEEKPEAFLAVLLCVRVPQLHLVRVQLHAHLVVMIMAMMMKMMIMNLKTKVLARL